MVALLKNNAFSTLAAGITNVATSLTVAAGEGALFPNPTAPEYFYATLIDTSNNLEIVKVTARATDVLTITRAQEGTTGLAYSIADRIELRLTAAGVAELGAYASQTKGADIASASPLVIGTDGGMFDVTGAVAFSAMTVATNRLFILQWDGIVTVTHGASIVLPGGANVTTAAGDVWTCYSTAANVVIVTNIATATDNTLKSNADDILSSGYAGTDDNDGTKSSGTYTPIYTGGNFKKIVNGGAFTLAPQANTSTLIIQVTNNASAGAVTTSGWTKVTGDSFTTTNGHDFMCYLTVVNSFKHLNIAALQ